MSTKLGLTSPHERGGWQGGGAGAASKRDPVTGAISGDTIGVVAKSRQDDDHGALRRIELRVAGNGYDSTIPEEENVIATQEELEKGKVKSDLDNRRRALEQICDLTQNLTSKAQEVHHVVFKVFDGGDGDANFLKIPFNVHRQFHVVVNGMLKAEGLEAIQRGNKNWMDAIQKDPATKAQVREILLNAASDFDTWCSQFVTGFGRRAARSACHCAVLAR